MKITEVTVSYAKTIQVPQYHPLRFGLSATATVDESVESREEVSRTLYKALKKQVLEHLAEDVAEYEKNLADL
jgi:hypothetical protein